MHQLHTVQTKTVGGRGEAHVYDVCTSYTQHRQRQLVVGEKPMFMMYAPATHSTDKAHEKDTVVFLSCPLVKKHADLSGSFLYSQSTMKDMHSKPTNRTKLSIQMKTKALRSHSIYIQIKERSGKETTRMFLNS